MMANDTCRRSGLPTRVAALTVLAGASVAAAQRPTSQIPEETADVEIVQKLGEQVPLDLEFVDESGKPVVLGDYFNKGKPVILTLVYFRCPMLCTLVVNGLVDALKQVPFTPGDEFEMVTVSINPQETPPLAKLKKQSYIKEYARPAAAQGWHFLTGKQKNIKPLAEAIGFKYRYDEASKEYIHAAGVFILTPNGRMSRVFYGVAFNSKDIRLALVEASDGEIGSFVDGLLMTCFQYDAEEGSYQMAAIRVMQFSGVLTALILGTVLTVYWFRESSRRAAASRNEGTDTDTPS